MAKPASLRLLAMPRGSTPHLELGLQGRAVLDLVGTWKVHRCTFVPGHTSLTAAKSGEMPQIAVLGAEMHSISAAQADPHSLCARCQPTTRPPPHGDQHDGLPAKPYAVQEHNVVNLAAARRYRPYPPGPHCLVPKRRSAGLQIRYRVL